MKDDAAAQDKINALRHQGKSELDAGLISMKQSKQEKKASSECCSVPMSGEDYPYGLRIDLSSDTLDKLGMDDLPDVGDELTLTAKVKVSNISESRHDGDKTANRSVGLQITNMSLE